MAFLDHDLADEHYSEPYASSSSTVHSGRAVARWIAEHGTPPVVVIHSFNPDGAQAMANIEAAMKNAPAGSEDAVAAFKKAMTTGQAAFQTAQEQAKQAVDAAGKNFSAAADMSAKATKTAVRAK
mgnify:CR=1 FL=1